MKLTIEKLRRFEQSLDTAWASVDEIIYDSTTGDIGPEEASDELNVIITALQTAIVEVES